MNLILLLNGGGVVLALFNHIHVFFFWLTVLVGQQCGPLQTYTKLKGTITSPQYPIEYRPHEDCQWTIVIEPGYDVILRADQMELPATRDCRWGDRLIVKGKRNGQLVRVTTLCGYDPIAPLRISGLFDELVLRFVSNRSCQGKGFVLEYEQVPAGVVPAPLLQSSEEEGMTSDKTRSDSDRDRTWTEQFFYHF